MSRKSLLREKRGFSEIIGFLIITVALFGTVTYVLFANAQKAGVRAQGLIDVMREAEARQGELLSNVYISSAGGLVFVWSYSDPDGDPQVRYQVQLASNNTFSTLLWDSGVVESSSAVAFYNGNPLSKGVTYYYRIKVFDGYEWTDWFTSSFVL
ncbi:MAG: hypothetical protein H5T49_00535 [Hadesarchaea archaeon]|nr:hypothetical protein [Hadesarchaea archaeon]